MKRIIAIIITLMVTFASCEKENPSQNNSNNNNEQPSGITINQIKGVWTIPDRDVYFLSLNPNMHYSLCLRTSIGLLVGSGTYSLSNNKLTLFHDYYNTTETLNVSIENNMLKCVGNMIPMGQSPSALGPVSFTLNKTTESFSPSKAGDKISWLPTFGPNGEYKEEFCYNTNNNASWIYYKKQSGIWQIIKTKNFYYVYRAPYTYTVQINTNEIKAYAFDGYEGSNGSINVDLP